MLSQMSDQLMKSSMPVTSLDEKSNPSKPQSDDKPDSSIENSSSETVIVVTATQASAAAAATTEAPSTSTNGSSSSSNKQHQWSTSSKNKFKLLRQSASVFAEAFEQPSSLFRRGRSREKRSGARRLLERLQKSSSEPSSSPNSLSRSIEEIETAAPRTESSDEQADYVPPEYKLLSSPVKEKSMKTSGRSSSRKSLQETASKSITSDTAAGNENNPVLEPILEENRQQQQQAGATSQQMQSGKMESDKKGQQEEEEEVANILGIHVHNLDRKIKSNQLIPHPLVKVHVMDCRTGRYLDKKHPSRSVVSYYENSSNQIHYILPVMTQACDLVQYIRYPRAAIWEELLLYNEDYEYFMSNNVLFLFEVLQIRSLILFSCLFPVYSPDLYICLLPNRY